MFRLADVPLSLSGMTRIPGRRVYLRAPSMDDWTEWAELRARLDASRIADCYLAPRAGLPLQRWGGALATICSTRRLRAARVLAAGPAAMASFSSLAR